MYFFFPFCCHDTQPNCMVDIYFLVLVADQSRDIYVK